MWASPYVVGVGVSFRYALCRLFETDDVYLHSQTHTILSDMRFLILSDLHGSLPVLQRVLDFYDKGGYDMLLLPGDLLNYGPRNGLPPGLDAPEVARLLSDRRADIVAVRGNCDSEVDQMLLTFPIMADYAIVCDGRHRIFLTHGHVYNEDRMPQAPAIDLFVYGHTHLMSLCPATADRPAVCNTGSPTFPKGGNPPSFATLEDGLLTLRRLDGTPLQRLRVFGGDDET